MSLLPMVPTVPVVPNVVNVFTFCPCSMEAQDMALALAKMISNLVVRNSYVDSAGRIGYIHHESPWGREPRSGAYLGQFNVVFEFLAIFKDNIHIELYIHTHTHVSEKVYEGSMTHDVTDCSPKHTLLLVLSTFFA